MQFLRRLLCLASCCLAALLGRPAGAGEPDAAKFLAETCRLSGGLCVQVGSGDLGLVTRLARTGRFLVQVLDDDPKAAAAADQAVRAEKLYGLISVEPCRSRGTLPYTEDLVNLLVVQGAAPPAAEVVRVLCPGGVLLMEQGGALPAGLTAVESPPGWLAGRKPRPDAMGEWSHPRHGADGNAVGADRLAGPPRRVRWVTGPNREIGTMVSAGGRNFYGTVWARDAFNGLPLWQHDLSGAPARPGYGYPLSQVRPRPVAAGDVLFAVTAKAVVALDAATGQELRRFPEAGVPFELRQVDGTLLTVDRGSVRALDAVTTKLRWAYKADAPRYVVATAKSVFLIEGLAERGAVPVLACLDLADGAVRWKLDKLPWVPGVRRIVAHGDLVACEVSTLNDTKEGNTLHLVSAADGKPLWSRTFVPSMNHMKQARALFIGDTLWVVENRKCIALDPRTGKEQQSYPAGLCHCFPPVATQRYIFSGEMELTDLEGGQFDAHRITKSACGRDLGLMPANGLIYVTPKHCVCWPMLRGYAAMAPARPAPLPDLKAPVVERGPAAAPGLGLPADADWPCYRRDAWRSSCSAVAVPLDLKPLWSVELGESLDGPIPSEWRENPFTRGSVTPPVVAYGVACVARPDAHEVVALDPATGAVRWRFTANGRVDTAPTLHRGLCLFGTRAGWVYCLRADSGQLVWRLCAAPADERIVAYGQVESPWPVAGSVLVVDDVAYFAAGRQPLADGGIRVFAVAPDTGAVKWTQRLDSLPTTNFYGCSGLEYDPVDLLHREGASVAMSRWFFDRATGKMTCKARDGFARFQTGGLNVIVPRRPWTYAPRHQPRLGKDSPPMRPLAVFRKNTLFGCLPDRPNVYRRDFDANTVKKFDTTWITGWAASTNRRNVKGEMWRSDRLITRAAWSVPVFPGAESSQRIAAMVLAGDTLFLAGQNGGLVALSATEGDRLARLDLPAPAWDGIAAAHGRLFVTTQQGQVLCLGGAPPAAP